MNRTSMPAAERASPHTGAGPTPVVSVGLELLLALGSVCLLPFRVVAYLIARKRLKAELAEDLALGAPVAPLPELGSLPTRPLTIFVACAEPSGEMHAVNLVRALRRQLRELGAPEPHLIGLGGERLAAEGVELIERPVDRAAMGLSGVLSALPYYMSLLRSCAGCFRDETPDLLLPVDSPALHVPLARIARRYGIPVVHFVTPQYWGWAPWRVGAYRRAVDRALTILPFEPSWFARHGVDARHVGHPIRDTWEDPGEAATSPTSTGEADALVILPGSREGVIERNLPWMLALAAELRLTRDVPVRIAHERAELEPVLRRHVEAAGATGWAEIEVGDLHRTLRGARGALAVSGTVLLELLHHRLPAVVVYRLAHKREGWMSRYALMTPFFSSVNLLSGRETYPEFAFAGDGPRAEVLTALQRSLDYESWRTTCRSDLDRAAERLGPPGAVERAAAQALAVVVPVTTETAPSHAREPESGSSQTPPRTDFEDALGHAS